MKTQLQSLKSPTTSAYTHLTHVLKQMILNNDRNAYQLFQHYSHTTKSPLPSSHLTPAQHAQSLKQYTTKCRSLLNKPNLGTQQQPQQPGPCGYVANLMEENRLLEKAGVGFGEEGSYLIFKAVQRFVVVKGVKEAKFWGKILGRERDYYILEVVAQGGEEGELPPDVQPKGTGINRNTYWVTSDLLSGQWKQLPLISPDQLTTSRRIKYIFSGDLQRQVYTNPFFNGKQKHLLKCQIVRITFGCTIVPRGMFNVNAQDKKEIQPAGEEWKLPGFNQLSLLDGWVHHSQNVLKCGRLTLMKPTIPQGEQVDQQKLMKELQAKDPLQQRLKKISDDKLLDGNGWTIKTIGDTSQYKALTKGKQTVNYGYIVVKSLVWKGWVLVCHNRQWCNVYVGLGQKSGNGWYVPREPELVLGEREERGEQSEPNYPVGGEVKEAVEAVAE